MDTLLNKWTKKQGKTQRNWHLGALPWSVSEPSAGNPHVAGCASAPRASVSMCLPLAGKWSQGSHTGEKTYDLWETKTNKKLSEMEIYGKKVCNHTSGTQPLSFTFTSGLKLFWNSSELPSKSEVCLEVLRLMMVGFTALSLLALVPHAWGR